MTDVTNASQAAGASAPGFGALAGISLGSSALSAAFNSKEASKNRDFQKKAMKHRYRWMMKDMKLAGLNPILAGNLGAGGIPGGSSASIGPIENPASSALANKNLYTQNKLLNEEVHKVKTQSELNSALAAKANAEKGLIGAQEATEKVRKFLVEYQGKESSLRSTELGYRMKHFRENEFLQYVELYPNAANTLLRIMELPAKYIESFNPMRYMKDKGYRDSQNKLFDKLFK